MFYSEPYANITFIDSWCNLNLSIFRTQNIQDTVNFWNTLYTELCVTLTYSQPMYIQALAYWEPEEYDGLCNSGIFRTWGIFQTLLNIYCEEFYSESCVTLAYLKPWHIQNQNTVSRISIFIILPNIYHEIFYLNSCVTLTYLEPYYIHHSGIF